ncbi:Caspase domain-containing protein [Chryseobacterium wanjuense]|uniref:Caspase domain-containing protein n=1 Tax=Chryseobacterium wanjuense TaxID=356305 RepID=A0A1I0QKB2_9FLAO|nr:caspase family protein [Chryseobacterium wanjuense]SEW27426.1 Caspase domain-containing protein [Chryseobacterium wanjuense]
MKKALIIGVNYYAHHKSLHGCVDDAYEVKNALERNADFTKNFDVFFDTAVDENTSITKKHLKHYISELFKDDSEVALFYFSGHGHLEDTGGYLVTSECEDGDDGVSMKEIIDMANNSKAKNKVIILDCCHSGHLGAANIGNSIFLSEGMTILTASTADQYASEVNGHGLFTNLLVDALNGGAANILGHITPGSVYAHIDQSLGAWKQRPMFKSNVKNFITLRMLNPSITLPDLRKITELFNNKAEHKLDPSYEPKSENPDKDNCEKFAIMQKYNRVNLVVPIDAEHMYFAAMESKACKLTALGEHYWNLVNQDRI